MHTTSRCFTVLTGCWLLAACVQPSAPTGDDSAKSPAKSPAASPDKSAPNPSAAVPPPASVTAGARAFVAVDGVGLHTLDERGWRMELETRAPIRDMLLLDGQLFVLSAFGIQRVEDGQAQTVAEIDRNTYSQIGDPLALASADGKTFWAAGPLGVARHAGSWELTPVAAQNPASIDVALDRAGSPYLAFGSLFRYQDASWLADASITSPLALLPDPRSDAMLVHGGCQADLRTCVVLRASSSAPPTRIEIAADACTDYNRMAVSTDGTRGVIAGRCGLLRFGLDPNEEAKPVRLGIAEGWPGQPLRSLALDAAGRVWAGTNNSLMLIAADGAIEEFPIGQLGDIAGPVGPLIVEGDGPPPPALGRVRNGDLTGVMVVLDGADKRPLPGASVELCSHLPPGGELAPDPARSPCAGVESTLTTMTDGEGRFAISNIPIGHYYFGVEIDGRWARGQPKALNMRAGMNGNVGKITVAVPK